MIEVITSIVMFALLIVLGLMGDKIFNKWVDRKYGPGSAEKYRKAPHSEREQGSIAGVGIIFFLLIFLIPTGIFGLFFLLPDVGAAALPVEVMILVIDFFLIKGFIAPFRNAKKWFAQPEAENAAPEFIGTENLISSNLHMPVAGTVFMALFAFMGGCIITLPLYLFVFENGSPLAFIVGLIAAGFAIWLCSPNGLMWIRKRRISKFGEPQAVFAELDGQGENIIGIDPYILRISPNYVLLCIPGNSYVWERKNLRCRETVEERANGFALYITENGKMLTLPNIGGTDGQAQAIANALCNACGEPETKR